ncbi:hypothetical protein CCUS01_00573 [Colletotrichum cuscutae]|uniref:Uncharacterized protein n=1 Tax=Colletotrichum cuscutae TaxID=1209917 RepID=A0AAI9Y743_9PEZI|nr:hypothetical protein CCUS01_00573 [Colletotrichum cuscutae]
MQSTNNNDEKSEGPHVAPGEPTPDLVDVGEEPSRLVIVPTKRPPGEKPFQIPEATGKPARYPEALVLTPSVESSRCLQALTSLHVQKGPTLHRVETAPPTNLAVTLGTTETRHALPGTTVTSTAAQRKRKSPSPENANAGVPHLHVPLSGSWPTCLGHYRPASEASRRPPQFEAVVNHRATSLALVSRACCFREGAELEQPQYVTMLLLIVGHSTLRSRLEMPYARPHLQ